MGNDKEGEAITEYEKQRLLRIRENKARLEALGLPGLVSSFHSDLSKSASTSTGPYERKKKKTKADEEEEYQPSDEDDEEEEEPMENRSSEEEMPCTSSSRRKVRSLLNGYIRENKRIRWKA